MKKILILEDNPAELKQLVTIVREINTENEIFFFQNVKDAYQCSLEKRIDLFLIDIILDTGNSGDTSGLRFVQNIRSIAYYEFTPVIFLTSLEDTKSYAYEKLHCYSFIEKPFDSYQVKGSIENCLRFPHQDNPAKTLYLERMVLFWLLILRNLYLRKA